MRKTATNSSPRSLKKIREIFFMGCKRNKREIAFSGRSHKPQWMNEWLKVSWGNIVRTYVIYGYRRSEGDLTSTSDFFPSKSSIRPTKPLANRAAYNLRSHHQPNLRADGQKYILHTRGWMENPPNFYTYIHVFVCGLYADLSPRSTNGNTKFPSVFSFQDLMTWGSAAVERRVLHFKQI